MPSLRGNLLRALADDQGQRRAGDLLHAGLRLAGERGGIRSEHPPPYAFGVHSGKAGPAFALYLEAFPKAKTPQERMLAIDQLIHAFHWDFKLHLPNRPAANNLNEGSMEQVIDLLDRLSYGDDVEAQQEWRENMGNMLKRRRGESSP